MLEWAEPIRSIKQEHVKRISPRGAVRCARFYRAAASLDSNKWAAAPAAPTMRAGGRRNSSAGGTPGSPERRPPVGLALCKLPLYQFSWPYNLRAKDCLAKN